MTTIDLKVRLTVELYNEVEAYDKTVKEIDKELCKIKTKNENLALLKKKDRELDKLVTHIADFLFGDTTRDDLSQFVTSISFKITPTMEDKLTCMANELAKMKNRNEAMLRVTSEMFSIDNVEINDGYLIDSYENCYKKIFRLAFINDHDIIIKNI